MYENTSVQEHIGTGTHRYGDALVFLYASVWGHGHIDMEPHWYGDT